ncbi:MAG: helix-hairpin-helix domain-containing protein [Patescibacteria group bacterium]
MPTRTKIIIGIAAVALTIVFVNVAQRFESVSQFFTFSENSGPERSAPSSTMAVSGNAVQTKININTASAGELLLLRGVGSAKADAIIVYREKNGLFRRIEDIMNVSGIGPAVFEGFRDQITVGDIPPPSISEKSDIKNISPTQSSSSTRTAAVHIVIAEIQISGGVEQTTNDFVKIFNSSAQPFNLKGFRLVKRTQSGTADTLLKSWNEDALIPAGGYYTWANASFTALAPPSDTVTTGSITSDNGVAIRHGPNNTGEIMDAVAWGAANNSFIETAPYPVNPGANQIIKRKFTNGVIEDTDNNSRDFEIR